jgi:hypothetical protein
MFRHEDEEIRLTRDDPVAVRSHNVAGKVS